MRIQPTKKSNLVPMSGDESLGIVLGAGVLLVILGGFHVMLSWIGLSGDDDALVHTRYSFDLSTTAWGWIHLVVGILALICGIGLLMGKSWAYIMGLVIAFVSALGSFAFLPQAPIWSALVIGFDVLVMWALVRELNEPA